MSVLDNIIGLIAPHRCLVCGNEGSLVCEWCRHDFARPLPSRCGFCQVSTADSRTCPRCRRKFRLKHVWVFSEYDDLPKTLIRGFKFERQLEAADVIAEFINQTLPFLPPNMIICHVPTITSHVRQRGYDHAKLIAARLAKTMDRKHLALLSRTDQLRQVGSKRSNRLKQLENSFQTTNPELIVGAEILLIDDVMTTGGTLAAASRQLYSKGAKSVSAAVFAQKQ